MHLKQFFRWNKIYIDAVSVIPIFRVSLQNGYKKTVITILNLQEWHVSRNKQKKIFFSLLQPGTLVHAVCQEKGLAAGGIELAQAQQKGF